MRGLDVFGGYPSEGRRVTLLVQEQKVNYTLCFNGCGRLPGERPMPRESSRSKRRNAANLDGAFTGRGNVDRAFTGRANVDRAFTGRANVDRAFTGGANVDRAFTGRANVDRAFTGRANVDPAFTGRANVDGPSSRRKPRRAVTAAASDLSSTRPAPSRLALRRGPPAPPGCWRRGAATSRRPC